MACQGEIFAQKFTEDYYLEEAKKLLNQAKDLYAGMGIREEVKNIYTIIATLHEDQENWRQASIAWRNVHELAQEIFTTTSQMNLQAQTVQFLEKEKEILRDKNAEIVLQKEELERQADHIRKTNIQLQELTQFKDALTTMIVHDLKNPLNTILLSAGIELSPSTQKRIIQAGKQMLQLVHNILDVAKFQESTINLSLAEVSVQDLLTKSLDEVRLLVEEKRLSVSMEVIEGLLVQVDVALFERVIVNILSNAIKYTPMGGIIIMRAYLQMQGETQFIRLEVTDTGTGIPAKSLENIFETFYQVEGKKSGVTSSTGLGLTFCKLIVEAHNGTIWAESKEGKGSTFIIQLPDIITQTSKMSTVDTGYKTKEADSIILPHNLLPGMEAPLAKLRQKSIHEFSKIMDILDAIPDENEGVAQWKRQILRAVCNGSTEEYTMLCTIETKRQA
jgi:signal transduction histidine kinase